MNKGSTNKPLAGLLLWVLWLSGSVHSTALADEMSHQGLNDLFLQHIEEKQLELVSETEKRTALVDQLDSITTEISAHDAELNKNNNYTPRVSDNLRKIKLQLASTDKQLASSQKLLHNIELSLGTPAPLSLWQVALGKSNQLEQQQLRAVQGYLAHTLAEDNSRLELQQRQLLDRQQTILQYGKGLSESIDDLHESKKILLERRENLEVQLEKITADLALKQDRVSRLTARTNQWEFDPLSIEFASLKKKLSDPIGGELLKRFAEPKARGLLKWQGMLVSAPLGLPFTAVSDGLVVFADSIKGLGKVAIVDHGQGYMSLYGMAELLMVEPNQLLLAGDLIGTVGESVANGTSALYFELRHKADTLDPQEWLAMQLITQKSTL